MSLFGDIIGTVTDIWDTASGIAGEAAEFFGGDKGKSATSLASSATRDRYLASRGDSYGGVRKAREAKRTDKYIDIKETDLADHPWASYMQELLDHKAGR